MARNVEDVLKKHYANKFGENDPRIAKAVQTALAELWESAGHPTKRGMEFVTKEEYGGRDAGKRRASTGAYQMEVMNALGLVTATFGDKALEYYKSAGLLSGLATITQNPISNAVRLLYEYGPKKVATDFLRKKSPLQSFREMGQMLRWSSWFASEGIKVAKDAFKYEMPILRWGRWGQKMDPNSKRMAIKGREIKLPGGKKTNVGRIVRLPFRLLTWGDEFFKMMSIMSTLVEEGNDQLIDKNGKAPTAKELKPQ